LTFFWQDKYAFDLFAIVMNIRRENIKYSDDALLEENAKEIDIVFGIISTKC